MCICFLIDFNSFSIQLYPKLKLLYKYKHKYKFKIERKPMSQYPSLDYQTGQGYNNNAAGYGNPNPYNQPPYNQGQIYGPPPAYNDNYEIYN
jgi:hypothetical protein